MSEREATGTQQMARMMTCYMAWANTTMFNSVSRISDAEIVKERQTLFGNIAHTFNHILVVHNIFQAHLEGKSHPYTARNTETSPPISDVREQRNPTASGKPLDLSSWFYKRHALSGASQRQQERPHSVSARCVARHSSRKRRVSFEGGLVMARIAWLGLGVMGYPVAGRNLPESSSPMAIGRG